MGFITDKAESSTSTFSEREDVEAWVHEFADNQGWDLSDVRNRAIMYYAMKYQNGELDDPIVDYNVDEKAEL